MFQWQQRHEVCSEDSNCRAEHCPSDLLVGNLGMSGLTDGCGGVAVASCTGSILSWSQSFLPRTVLVSGVHSTRVAFSPSTTERRDLSRLRLYLFLVLFKSQTLLQTRYGITDFVLCNAVRQSDLKLAPTAGHSQEDKSKVFDIHP